MDMNTIELIAIVIFGLCISGAIYILASGYDTTKAAIKKYKIQFDFGLASKQEVMDKYGEEIGTVILEERQIVFWNFGWVWAVFGAIVFEIVLWIIRKMAGI